MCQEDKKPLLDEMAEALRDIVKDEAARRKALKKGSPAHRFSTERLAKAEKALEQYEGRELRQAKFMVKCFARDLRSGGASVFIDSRFGQRQIPGWGKLWRALETLLTAVEAGDKE